MTPDSERRGVVGGVNFYTTNHNHRQEYIGDDLWPRTWLDAQLVCAEPPAEPPDD